MKPISNASMSKSMSRSLKVKANEIAEVMEYTDLQIGQSLGILRQSNLVKG